MEEANGNHEENGTENEEDEEKLYLRFHGRIIDSLGIQMYQSPVAAVAELIANAWDADAKRVTVTLPSSLSGNPKITVKDNGFGMTFEQCQARYLNVGRNRRIDEDTNNTLEGRPLLGRKGIGKFAGFGIAAVLEVDTTSRETGERTKFQLNLKDLRSDAYIGTEAKEVPVLLKSGPSEEMRVKSGTTVTLRELTLKRTPNEDSFGDSMARRFLIHQTADEFAVFVNNKALREDNALSGVEFDFPGDYKVDERPEGLRNEEGYGAEEIGSDQVRWRIKFTKAPIDTEELRGVSVFCGIKVAQTPFFFNLSGGLPGQHGQQYLSGQVQADYLDQLSTDMITTERQRLNWELEQAQPLEKWGQERIKSLLSIWKKRRAEERTRQLDEKVAQFSSRLERLKSTERRTVLSALKKIATIDTLSNEQFNEMSSAILTAWEGGRLHALIGEVAGADAMDEGVLLNLLAEAQVLNALHVAEAVRAKVEIIEGLRKRIENRKFENAVRDYIAENPWLLAPEWETFKKEISVRRLVEASADEAGLNDHEDWNGRVDLVLSAGTQLLVIEFMRPGLTVDIDHINRYQIYVDILRAGIKANSGLGFLHVSGLLVADKLNNRPAMNETLDRLAGADMKALDWGALLDRASKKWKDFLDILVSRAPDDERLAGLKTSNAADGSETQVSAEGGNA